MAHPILEKLAQERAKLLSVVSPLPEEMLERPVSDGWTIRDTLTHLLNAEEDHCKVVAVAVRGEHNRLPRTFSLDEHNLQRLQQRGKMTLQELLAALATQRQRTEALFTRLDGAQFDVVVNHPALGETTVAKIFRIIALHERMHLKEIVAALEDGSLSKELVRDQ